MEKPNFAGLMPIVARKLAPIIDDIVTSHAHNIHSIYVVGSAVLPDYDERLSDINSVVVLNRMDLQFIEFLAPLGKKYGKQKIAAPLVMTPEYIQTSLDTFPLEFYDFKLIHRTILGQDLMSTLLISKPTLRLQCEREVKTKILNVRQGYISSLGKKDLLAAMLVRSITGSMAFFRGTLSLLGKEPPIPRSEVVSLFSAAVGVERDVFETMLRLKAGTIKPTEQELRSLFERYYHALESTGKIIDDLRV